VLLATLARPGLVEQALGFPVRVWCEILNPRSNIVRALAGSELPIDAKRIYARNLEVPSGGGVGTARAIARAYSAFAPRQVWATDTSRRRWERR
jgi:hypothetical protein